VTAIKSAIVWYISCFFSCSDSANFETDVKLVVNAGSILAQFRENEIEFSKNLDIKVTATRFSIIWYITCFRSCSGLANFETDVKLVVNAGSIPAHFRENEIEFSKNSTLKWRRPVFLWFDISLVFVAALVWPMLILLVVNAGSIPAQFREN
jgi:hypothetical protein